MKHVKLLLVSILLMVLMTGCGNKQVEPPTGENTKRTENTKNKENKVYVADELFDKYEPSVEFVVVKLLGNEYIPSLDNEGNGTYYSFYRISEGSNWINPEYIELPVELQLGEFAYVKADTTFITGGIDGRMHVEFKEIKECNKISLDEAANLIDIFDMYECETQYSYGFGGFARHSKVNDCLMVGGIENRYDEVEGRENSFNAYIEVYFQSEFIGQFNRLEFVGDYFVFFNGEDDGKETELPENITVDAIEKLLDTGMQYNDSMFVLSKRDGTITAYTGFLQGDRELLDESQTDMWYIPDFQDDMLQYEYTYLDVNADGSSELLVQLADDPCGYNGVFHYEEGRIYCWNSDSAEMSCRDYPLQDGIMVRQYDQSGARSYKLFKYNSDGTTETVSTLFVREELIPEDSTEKCPYYAIDGIEVDKNDFDEKLNALVMDKLLERTAWITWQE